jgi:hypothetical protein
MLKKICFWNIQWKRVVIHNQAPQVFCIFSYDLADVCGLCLMFNYFKAAIRLLCSKIKGSVKMPIPALKVLLNLKERGIASVVPFVKTRIAKI